MENAKLTPRKPTMAECDRLSSAIVNATLIESENGSNDFVYVPQVRNMISLYLKLNSFFPEVNVKDILIEDFFEKYSDGEYREYESVLESDRRSLYIDEAVDYAIETAIRDRTGGRLATAAAALVDNIDRIAEKYADSLQNIGAADLQNFLKDFGKLASDLNPQTVADAVVKIHQSEAGKPKRTRKKESTTNKTTNE